MVPKIDINDLENALKAVVNVPHQFSVESGVVLEHIERDRAEGRLTVTENTLNPHGMVHGGALCTLADTVCGICACSRGNTCVTTNSTMEYLRPATGPWIRCVATPRKMGRTMSIICAELTDSKGQLVATGTYTFFMMAPGDGRLDMEKREKA